MSISTSVVADNILIYIRDDVYEDYISFIKGREVLEIKSFSGKTIRRDVVDMIIAQQALKLGGFEHTFQYASGKVNFRNTKMLEAGKLLISFDSYWLKDALTMQDNLHISAPVIRNGEYVAGIYTPPKRVDVLSIDKLEDLAKFTAVSTPKWRTDWQTLDALPLRKLVREDEWLSMARMVNMGWVDFMLMPFHSTPDKSFTLENIHLIPVPGVAIALEDSRHFVISKKHIYGKEAFKAINIGLKALRSKGAITKAYQQAGFFVDKSKIKILNQSSKS
ncbi:hypothetical protein HII17_07090 [Thalassotalea sp. M1531]|uniref:Solute-binding protein family 3/N-terminal domain-containing protein n=1 Tax=Thalassotalea algicola TaxID=2716224 RepID=A0A7Y0Q6Y9_9GAMM|nr:hypothetical protein [Thalassotalea algicola]